MSIHKLRQLFARVGAFIYVRKIPNFFKENTHFPDYSK